MINSLQPDGYRPEIRVLDYKPNFIKAPRGKKDMDVEVCGTQSQIEVFAENFKRFQKHIFVDDVEPLTKSVISRISRKFKR